MAIKIKKKRNEEPVVDPELDDVEGEGAEDVAEDKFISTSLGFAKWIDENKKRVLIGIGAMLVLVIAFIVWFSYDKAARLERSEALNDAIGTYSVFTVDEVEQTNMIIQLQAQSRKLEPVYPKYGATFATDEARHEAVFTAANEVASEHSGTSIAAEANLLAGAAAHHLGKKEEAGEHLSVALEGFELDESGRIFAQMGQATMLIDEQKYDDAVALYRAVLEETSDLFGPAILIQIGTVYEIAGRDEDAASAYAELIGRYSSANELLIDDARSRLGVLVSNADALIAGFGGTTTNEEDAVE